MPEFHDALAIIQALGTPVGLMILYAFWKMERRILLLETYQALILKHLKLDSPKEA